MNGLFFLAMIFCFEWKHSSSEGVEIGNILSRLMIFTAGDDGRGSISINGLQREVNLGDQIAMRIGSIEVSGFGIMERDVGEKVVDARFPQLSLFASVEVHQPLLDASTSGEAILRFLDVKMRIESVVVEGSLEEVDVKLECGASTTAFDLEDSSPRLQMELAAKRKIVEEVFRKIVEEKIQDFIRHSEGEKMEWALDVPAAADPSVSKANRFVDELLADNRQALKDAIGVLKLPDEYFKFSKKILLVETHGFARLTKGRLDNLHAIVRKGDCQIYAQNDALNVVINLGLDNVLGGYYIEVQFGYFSATSDLKLKIESVQLIIKGLHSFREIHEQANPEDTNILNFDLALNVQAHLGDIDVDVNIFGPLDWLFNLIAEKVVSSLKGRLQGMIKDPIKDAIKSIGGGKLKY